MLQFILLSALSLAAPAAGKVEPYPVNLGPGTGLRSLQFSPAIIAERQNFNNVAAGSFRPTDDHLRGPALAKAVGALKSGAKIEFNANTNRGTIELLANDRVGAWTCKQVLWTIVRKKASAQRHGLFCMDGGNWTEIW
ncbi:hypothetical protein IC614_06410 [Allosphingosinicella flava]|uniref:Uncharacterized protein n=1 Tax=Allosphingosinicella flava TaxID=2771430 RepID=A0A7T2LL09_9SPHN|nr:hypothetical protein [Sphingosinicella flava]QPQ54010.1 hypothetical protein IC614_06410 [Sphingosinicella flava]